MNYYWNVKRNTVYYNANVSQQNEDLFKDYLVHRFRILFAKENGFHFPMNWDYKEGILVLSFSKLDALNNYKSNSIKNDFDSWKEDEFLPLLFTFIESLKQDIYGFMQFSPIKGKFIPPVSFFYQKTLSNKELDVMQKKDTNHFVKWIRNCITAYENTISEEEKKQIDDIIISLINGDFDEIQIPYNKTKTDISFLDILTEAEFFQKIREVYKYKIVPMEQASKYGRFEKDELLLEINTNYLDNIFGKIHRSSPQEIWDLLMGERRISRLLVITDEKYLPNPLSKISEKATLAEWFKVHEDQPLIFIKKFKERIPSRGYLYIFEYGDIDLIYKKRRFIQYAKNHVNLSNFIDNNGSKIYKKENKWSRKQLVQKIIANKGIFAVQGPPGTGKTFLATEVVKEFLLKNKHAKILICSKEHLALNHILFTITALLKDSKIDFRAYRSLSPIKMKETFDQAINYYLQPSIMKEISNYNWSKKSKLWNMIQSSLHKEFDLRNRSIAKEAANLFFCTTMDAALNQIINAKAFDLVIIEEAGKCYPSELLHILCLGSNVLMIGDQNQLPPYQIQDTIEAIRIWEDVLVKAKNNRNLFDKLESRFRQDFQKINRYYNTFGKITDTELEWLKPFELLYNILPSEKTHMLDEQYRLEKPLSKLIGKVFYKREFLYKKNVYNPLKDVVPNYIESPMLWIDTPHITKFPEAGEDPEKKGVRTNEFELEIILSYLSKLTTADNDIDLVILTPYNDQKRLLLESEKLVKICLNLTKKPIIEIIRTIDEFQGHEADLTIISLVRNNTIGAKSSWGFLSESERLNVMFSRAKSKQVVVGCSEHILRNKQEKKLEILYKLLSQYQQLGKFISAEVFLKIEQ